MRYARLSFFVIKGSAFFCEQNTNCAILRGRKTEKKEITL